MKNRHELVLTVFGPRLVYVTIWEKASIIIQGRAIQNQFITILNFFNTLKIKRDFVFPLNVLFIEILFTLPKKETLSASFVSFPIFFHSFKMSTYTKSLTKIIQGSSSYECLPLTLNENIYFPYIDNVLENEKKAQ